MRRIFVLLAGFAPAPAPTALSAQASAGTELWRLAATTLPLPPALASGGTSAFWNPAQPPDTGRARLAIDLIETAAGVGATGVLLTAHARIRPVGRLGVVYGRMGIGDLVRTSLSPEPDPGTIPFYTQAVGATWILVAGRTTLGATLAYHDTQLDLASAARWTLDVGARHVIGEALTLVAATHSFARFTTSDPAQDLYGGLELRVWHGPLWGSRAAVRARYGVSTAHGFTTDHLVGAGFELGQQFGADLVVTRGGSYGEAAWRAVAGVRMTVGRYAVRFARGTAANDVGAAYRVGLEATIP